VGKAKDIVSIKEHPSLCWNAGKTKPFIGCGDNSEFSEIMLDGYSLHCECHAWRKFNLHAERSTNEH
jgi:hypothetical protein